QQVLMLAALTTKERDRFGIVADAHEAIPEIGLLLVTLVVNPYEAAPDQYRGGSATTRIEQQTNHELPGYAPEHPEKPAQCDHRVDDHQQVSEDTRGELSYVIGDALIGIVDGLGTTQTVIGPVVEIASNQMLRHPFPPRQRQPI